MGSRGSVSEGAAVEKQSSDAWLRQRVSSREDLVLGHERPGMESGISQQGGRDKRACKGWPLRQVRVAVGVVLGGTNLRVAKGASSPFQEGVPHYKISQRRSWSYWWAVSHTDMAKHSVT